MDRAATRPTAAHRRLIRLPDVIARTGLSKTTIWRGTRSGDFPKPVTLTRGTVGWVEDEVDRWIDAKIEARGALKAPATQVKMRPRGESARPHQSRRSTPHYHDRRAFRQKRPPAWWPT